MAQKFIDRFGYDLTILGPNGDTDKHIPKDIDPSLPQEEQNKVSNRQNVFYKGFRKVSHL